MRTRVLLAILMVAVGGRVGAAQDGLRSAVLPERTPSSARQAEDLFAVEPGFYRRRPELRRDPPLAILPSPWPGPYAYLPPMDPDRRMRPVRATRPARRRAAHLAVPVATSPPPVQTPGPPKTFYVIAGCYAGDRRPEPRWLPDGCDLSRLRVLPPK